MRVLLTNTFPLTGSGSGVYTLNLANMLTRLGHEVCVIFPEHANVRLDYDFKCAPVLFSSENNSDLREGILPFNFPCFTTHPRSQMTFEDLSANQETLYRDAFTAAIAKQVKEFKPDIIHCGHIWIIAEIASQFDVPLVITAHGTDIMGYAQSRRFRNSALLAAKNAKAIIAISHQNIDLIYKNFVGIDKAKVHLILNGYDSFVFYPQDDVYKNVELAREKFLSSFEIENVFDNFVCFAGKFTEFKGIDTLIKAAGIYTKQAREVCQKNVVTLISGDGQLFDEMVKLAESLNLQNNVFFLHNQPQDVLNKMYNISDVSVVSSVREPFGLVAIEALACGTPVVGSNDGGLVDILNKDCGVLVEPKNEKQFADAIFEIISAKLNFDSKFISKYAYDSFSLDTKIMDTIKIYESV
ncbi:MAG: glycosyltransferase [Coriobacteriales bacterium]|nr:glycosyltransferase [Coriobacteriales bacterium]